ncbi:kinase-like domain-containing protein [Lactarius vividus]|nr:kinase-like domain-containing protein [Lactarius vividus]
MPWQTPLDTCLKTTPTVAESLQYQLLEGVWFLHEHGIAHLDLKPDNLVVGYTSVSSSQPKLSIIDYGVSTHAEGEGTLLEGYHGTRDWSAPEVEDAGTGTSKKYSAVLADRWSCGRVLWYIGQKCEVDNTSMLASTFTSISN